MYDEILRIFTNRRSIRSCKDIRVENDKIEFFTKCGYGGTICM